jgi:membrane protein
MSGKILLRPLSTSIKGLFRCLFKAGEHLVNHDGIEHAGYMAFMSLLAIFPFLVFFFALAGSIGETQIGEKFVQILLSHLPPNITNALKPRILEIIQGPPQSLMNMAILGAIWTSSSSLEGLRTILNRVYHVLTPPAYIFRRLLSIAQFITLTILLIVGMFLLIFVPVFLKKFSYISFLNIGLNEFWTNIRYAVVIITLFFVVISLYYIIPNAKLTFLELIPGAIIVVLLWVIGAEMLSEYFERFHQVNLIYGSIEGLIASLLFFYTVNLIFIYGAEFNYILKHYYQYYTSEG